MYVTTFYSFKGGVGRTFALVNVGAELARAGRKVLLVDLDLEAPGIHTFNALSPKQPHPGMVECVTDYMATQAAPDVRQYVYEVEDVAEQEGRMWVMPAGRGDREYRQRLASINWQSLYQDADGYLFFEDLKAQWKEAFDPDYVLIDSRTGHTDIEGICTRQLPDAAVILFFPNEQNLCGLREVVRDIKAESNRTRKNAKPVTLHFVMSNVPDLDDEDGILRDRIRKFRRALECETLSRIHNYPSLALLNQTIFTKERTKSRLAREYRRLKDQIVDENDEDPEGVARLLKRIVTPRPHGSRSGFADTDQRLEVIQEKHANNGEVNFLLGLVSKSQANFSEAAAFFDRAMELGFRTDAVLLERATCRFILGNRVEATQDVEKLLSLSNMGDYEVYRAVQLLRESDKELLDRVPQSTAFQSLDADEKWIIARTLHDKGALAASVDVFRALIHDPRISRGIRQDVQGHLVLSLIGLHKYDEAMRMFGPVRPSPHNLDIYDAFNYAMAEWAETGDIPQDLFARVVELVDTPKPRRANREQCFSLAFWAIGDTENAESRIAKAEEMAHQIKKTDFSFWRYREIGPETFLEDCKAIRKLIRTGEGRPLFFPDTELQ